MLTNNNFDLIDIDNYEVFLTGETHTIDVYKRQEYNIGLSTFNDAKKVAEEGFVKAEENIKESEEKLHELKKQKDSLEQALSNEEL